MLSLTREALKNRAVWEKAGIKLPKFEHDEMMLNTRENPTWVHFGAGNIFRAFIAMLQQELLNLGAARTGIVAVEPFDFEIIERVYTPYGNLGLVVTLHSDGTLDKKVVASISESLIGDISRQHDWNRLKEIFTKPCLQMVTFTISEKGYNLRNASGEYLEEVKRDMEEGPDQPGHVMSKVGALLYARYKNGQLPVALVSLDNCSHNGTKLKKAVETIVQRWVDNRLVEEGFLEYVLDTHKVSFPWTVIDKITPRPSEDVKAALEAIGFGDTEIIRTSKNTYVAPFVNTEGPQYLVVEDVFPNGRPPLELVGVLFTDRETVDRVEKMKVCTCLNPLHTALAVFGCLLGYNYIAEEMRDSHLKKLVERIGYEEGLPVVVDPGILDPEAFLQEVIEKRLPNPYIPDTPQRIMTDTSQKMSIRFGETIKAYRDRAELDPASLTYIPLVIAGWCRYLMGLDDKGNPMQLSPDPMLPFLQSCLAGVRMGDITSLGDSLKPILSNKGIFGLDLYKVGLGQKIEGYFAEMISGAYAVRATLQKYL